MKEAEWAAVSMTKKICAGAVVESGLAIRGSEAAKSESKVSAWAKKSADRRNALIILLLTK